MKDCVILYTTWPDAETAEAAGAEAVAERLAACVNILGPMRSLYRWQGAIERTTEIPVIYKTTTASAEALRDFLTEKHPHEIPAIIALPLDTKSSSAQFLSWISSETI